MPTTNQQRKRKQPTQPAYTPPSEFTRWFREQFGARPSQAEIVTLEREMADLKDRIQKADDVLRRTRAWDETKNSCLYAWNFAKQPLKHRWVG